MIVIIAAKMLLIYVDEADRDDDMPLYEVIVRRLIQSDIKGVSVHAGIMGFGTHHRIHQKGLLGISDDRPVTITAVDKESVCQGRSIRFPRRRRKRGPLFCWIGRFPLSLEAAGAEPATPAGRRA